MKKILLIVQKEYLSRVKTRAFVLTTLLGPLGVMLLFILPVWLNKATTEVRYMAVLDQSGQIMPIESGHEKLKIEAVSGNRDSLKTNYAQNGYAALIHIPQNFDINNPAELEIYSEKQLGMMTKLEIESAIAERVRMLRIKQAGYDEAILKDLMPSIELKQITAGEGKVESTRIMLASAIGYGMGFIIYIALLIYGTMVMRGVIQEKTSRIVEIMISSVKPFQLMAGKIIGIGLVGLTQFLLWIVLSLTAITVMGMYAGTALAEAGSGQTAVLSESEMADSQSKIVMILENVGQLPVASLAFAFAFYFLGGFFIYGALFAAIGSAVGEEGDSQSMTFPVTIPIIASIIMLFSVINEPDSSLAFWTSIIPLTSPIIMPARIAFGVPFWEIALSVTCLIIGFVFTTWMAGRIYRTGILMYGKKITFGELFKWMKQN